MNRIEALRRDLPDIEWHVHGAGPAYPAETFAGRERLIYHGAFRSLEEHARILQGLDAVVLFSRHNEGMPLSLIEAMSAGLPWIANDRGGVREIAAAARHAWLLPLDADDEKRAATVRAAAAEIRAGACSRVSQRQAYERHYRQQILGALLVEYRGDFKGTVEWNTPEGTHTEVTVASKTGLSPTEPR